MRGFAQSGTLAEELACLPAPQGVTNAPWHVETIVADEGDALIFGVCHPGTVCDATTVCNVFSEADAHLIAASRELYAACKAAEEWLSGWASAEPQLGAIRSALAKAETRQKGGSR